MKQTMRPGIYTDYTLTPVYRKHKGKSVGIIAQTEKQTDGVQAITSLSQAQRVFGDVSENNRMMQLISVLFALASPIIYAVGLTDDSDSAYHKAIGQLSAGQAYLILMDSQKSSLYRYLDDAVNGAGEKLGIVTGISGEEPDVTAKSLNSMRMCLAYPVVTVNGGSLDVSAAVLAAMISQNADAGTNLNGTSCSGNFTIADAGRPNENQVEQYLSAGVCVLEQQGSELELIRGLTTATIGADSTPDYTYRNLGVVLILDTVIPALRQTLKQRLAYTKNNQVGLNTILSVVICRLDDFVDTGLIHSYDTPNVTLDEDDPTICLVEVGFVVTQGISSIYLTAHISI